MKMDVILAILVLGAVIFFGALISAGNERQRKALDGIREQTALWAMQDLRLKREKLAQNVKVDDPIVWLNHIASKTMGETLNLNVTEIYDAPKALVTMGQDGRKIVFSPAPKEELLHLKKETKSRLSRGSNIHPLLNFPRGVEKMEISMLNGGILFDLELSLAWKGLTGMELVDVEQLQMYIFE
jgi:hypothetical protein